MAAVLVAVVGTGLYIQSFSHASSVVGDINADNIVNVFDLSLLLASWGTTNTAADLNSDGVVNVFDLSLLLSNWGKTGPTSTPTPSPTPSPSPSDTPIAADPYAAIAAAADRPHLEKLLKDMTGYNPVQVNGQTVKITERYTPASKALYRAYWKDYFTSLGAIVKETTFPVQNLVGETTGTNLEATFPGKSADSVVAIVHYDSTGAPGMEAQNPAVDDNMTPMAMMMESARVLSAYKGRLNLTLRFVATDYEEITTIEGGKAYLAGLQQEAAAQNFKIVADIDGELAGWSCWGDGKCGSNPPAANSTFTLFSCTSDGKYNNAALGQQMADVVTQYSSMKVTQQCDGDTNGSELYNFWQAGIPSFYFNEYMNDSNDHFDSNGGDTLDRINLDYFYNVGKTIPVMIAKLVGVQ